MYQLNVSYSHFDIYMGNNWFTEMGPSIQIIWHYPAWYISPDYVHGSILKTKHLSSLTLKLVVVKIDDRQINSIGSYDQRYGQFSHV